MKAITLWQPWASLLACGAKKFETRSWATKYRGPIVIHAASRPCFKLADVDPAADNAAIMAFGKSSIPYDLGDFYEYKLPCGCIIATAELVGCWRCIGIDDNNNYAIDKNGKEIIIYGHELMFGNFGHGRYAWEFKNMELLPNPIPAKGKQGLWDWNESENKKRMDKVLPIIDFEDSFDGMTDTLHKNCIPLCPHCKEWSYYTTKSAKQNNGVHICQFCGGGMYMPEREGLD